MFDVRKSPLRAALIALAALSPVTLVAQGTAADYERAEALAERARGKVFKFRVEPTWSGSRSRFWYRNDLSGGRREFVLVDAEKGERRAAFDHERLAKALADSAEHDVDAARLPLGSWRFEDDGTLRFNALDRGWRCNLESYELSDAERLEEPSRERSRSSRRRRGRSRGPSNVSRESPDGRWSAFVKDENVWLRASDGGEEFALSDEGTEPDGYVDRFYWSSDSRRLVTVRRAHEQEHRITMVESSPKDQVQPKVHTRQYLKPGDRIAISKPHLFDVEAKREIPVSDELFPNPWRISDIRWAPDSRRFTFLYNERGHQILRIVAVDAETGEAGAIVDERSATFLDYAHKEYTRFLDDTHELVWMSERDGWNHLYLLDSRSGHVKNRITKGEWVVRGVDRVDVERRQIWFRAGGIFPEQDPYYVHFCRVDFDGESLVVLTRGNGTHEISFSPDRRFFIDRYSRVDMPGVTELRRSEDGALVVELERADWTDLLATGWRPPERFTAKGRDGTTDIHGVIYFPTTHAPEGRYPVIERIYAGPHGAHVPKSFRAFHRVQSLVELGFIAVQIDGMGTSYRSKAFHDVCWKNLKDAGFPDRILWMKAAAKKHPSMDLERVGIYGGSAGGQSTLSGLLHHPEFYKVGVADCGCHDNRMDKIWWNELWMGWPVGPEYADNSNVTHAHRLRGKLLLTVGELDTNVDPASTMQVVDALIKADRDFDFLVVPGAGHGVGDSLAYAVRRRRDFFVRHLLGVEPRMEAPPVVGTK